MTAWKKKVWAAVVVFFSLSATLFACYFLRGTYSYHTKKGYIELNAWQYIQYRLCSLELRDSQTALDRIAERYHLEYDASGLQSLLKEERESGQ